MFGNAKVGCVMALRAELMVVGDVVGYVTGLLHPTGEMMSSTHPL